jgi:hypothetical protein
MMQISWYRSLLSSKLILNLLKISNSEEKIQSKIRSHFVLIKVYLSDVLLYDAWNIAYCRDFVLSLKARQV